MGGLLFAAGGSRLRRERLNALFGVLEGGADAWARGSPDDVVAVERGFESDGREEVGVEFGTELTEFVEGEIAELAAFIETVTDGVTNFLVGFAEGNSLVDEVGGGGHSVEES